MYDIIFIQPEKYDNPEWKRIKSKYPLAKIVSSFREAQRVALTDFFWTVYDDLLVNDDFEFDYTPDKWSSEYIHVFKNGNDYDGIALVPKLANVTENEINYRFFVKKKDVDIIASTPINSKIFDIVFISYEEPNADENYEALLKIAPRAKRVHGVKGIHQAHIAAASLCRTNMFWVVDADATIVDGFNFDYYPLRRDQDIVHVWRCQNPINGLVYGYGGVKLLPTELTLNMDLSKPDMTTSITHKFKAVQSISNITGFNTDPYNTWKSAFRECVKLSSRIIDRQKDDETQQRLQTWCTVGKDKPFGDIAIRAAKLGAAYGARHQNDPDALKKINDFSWLKEQFNNENI